MMQACGRSAAALRSLVSSHITPMRAAHMFRALSAGLYCFFCTSALLHFCMSATNYLHVHVPRTEGPGSISGSVFGSYRYLRCGSKSIVQNEVQNGLFMKRTETQEPRAVPSPHLFFNNSSRLPFSSHSNLQHFHQDYTTLLSYQILFTRTLQQLHHDLQQQQLPGVALGR